MTPTGTVSVVLSTSPPEAFASVDVTMEAALLSGASTTTLPVNTDESMEQATVSPGAYETLTLTVTSAEGVLANSSETVTFELPVPTVSLSHPFVIAAGTSTLTIVLDLERSVQRSGRRYVLTPVVPYLELTGSNGTSQRFETPKEQLEAADAEPVIIVKVGGRLGPRIQAEIGTALYFDASESYDPEGTVLEFSWDFADGTIATGQVATHAFQERGVYDVTVTATDGNSTVATLVTVAVAGEGDNREPVLMVAINGSSSPSIDIEFNDTIFFDASSSYDPDGEPLQITWEFGDGEYTSGMTATYKYPAVGTYFVIVTAMDSEHIVEAAFTLDVRERGGEGSGPA
jgi:chitodextrinase